MGFILGPAIGGMLASYGLMMPFLVAAAFNLLNFLFGLLVLPESLPLERRRPFDYKALNPFHSLKALTKMPAVNALIAVHVLMQLSGQTHPFIWVIYTEHRYA